MLYYDTLHNLRYFTLRYVILRYVTDPLLDVRCEGNLALWGVNVNEVDGTSDLNVIGWVQLRSVSVRTVGKRAVRILLECFLVLW